MKRRFGEGYSVLAMMILLPILAFVIIRAFEQYTLHQERAMASSDAVMLAEVASAMRRYIAHHVNIEPGEYQDIEFLRECESREIEYISCDFTFNPVIFDASSLLIDISDDDGVMKANINFGGVKDVFALGGVTRQDLVSLAMVTANGGLLNDSTPVRETFAIFEQQDNSLVANVSNNPELDSWLRVDGLNSPTADIDWDGNNLLGLGDVFFEDKGDVCMPSLNDGRGGWLRHHVEVSREIKSGGDIITKPSCQSGDAPTLTGAVIRQFSSNVNPEYLGHNIYAKDNGASWSLVHEVATSDGVIEVSGGDLSLIEVRTYCKPINVNNKYCNPT